MSILIKNGLIYDGRGQPPFKRNILIRGKQISGIGVSSKHKADRVIDAADTLVMPGFVDINSASDHYLNILTDPYQERSIEQGITTSIAGSCGSSLAPLLDGSLASIHKWGSPYLNGINLNWHSFADFIKILKKRGLGINFGSLVGHATIKRAITGEESRDLTQKELDFFKQILRAAFKEGAFGFSTGFEYAYARQTPHHEIIELAGVTAEAQRIYATHLRYPEDKPLTFSAQKVRGKIKDSYEEIINIMRKTRVNTEINHFQPRIPAAKAYHKAQEAFEKELKTQRINVDCHPYEVIKIPIYRLLPDWLQQEGSFEAIARAIHNPNIEELVLNHLKTISRKSITIAHVPAELAFLKGKTIKAFAEERNTTQAKALLELMRLSSLQAVCLYHNVHQKSLEELLYSDISLIASNGLHLASPDYQPFIEFIRWAKSRSNLSLEQATTKCTALPAVKYGITKRGVIKENYYADIVILHNMKVRDVLINGEVVFENGLSKKLLKGEVLKHV